LVGDDLSLHVQGSGLSTASLIRQDDKRIPVSGGTQRSSSDATFLIRFVSSGVATFPFNRSVYDGTSDDFALRVGCDLACYSGSGQLTLMVRLLPRVASVSPTSAAAGTSVALAGFGLTPKGYNAIVDFTPKYKTSRTEVISVPATVSGSGLSVVAPSRDVVPVATNLRFVVGAGSRDSLAATTADVPSFTVTGFAPVLARLDSVGPVGARRPMIRVGDQQADGTNLTADGGASSLLMTNITTSTRTSTTAAPLPLLTFGSLSLGVQSAGYRSSSTRLPGLTGADSVMFTVPAGSFADTVTRALTITTPVGKQTLQNVMFVPPPSVSELRTFNTSGIDVAVPLSGGTLVRGKQYRLRGTGLVIRTTAGSTPDLVRVSVNGAAATTALATSPTTDAVFTVPTTATSGAVTLTAAGGTATLGSFSVIDAPTAVAIAGLSLSPTSVAGGRSITATVAVNGTIPAGGNAGNIAFTLVSPSDAVVLPSGFVAVTTNPLVVTIPTRAVSSQQTVSIRVSSDPNASSLSQQTASLTLTPPTPTSVALSPTSVAGGTGVRGVVHLNTTAAASAALTVALINSDPTTATIPATAAISGDSAVFNVTTAIVPVDRPVTITATSGGQSQSATLTVKAPALTRAAVQPTSIIPGASSATVTLALSGAVATPTTTTITCDPALTCPANVTLNAGQSTATFAVTARPVPLATAAPIDVALNGVTQRATLTLTPLAVQTLTVSPATVQAGTPSSLTIQLNTAVPAGQSATVAFTSSNAAVTAPSTITFGAGDVTKLVTLTTHGPLTQATVVTITTTFSQATSTTANSSTKTTSVSVNP
jgi:hypothetical protein